MLTHCLGRAQVISSDFFEKGDTEIWYAISHFWHNWEIDIKKLKLYDFPKTLENLLGWSQRLKDVAGEIPTIVLANKSDLTDHYISTDQELQEYSSRLNAPYFKTSAKFGDNVLRTFYKLGEFIADDVFRSSKRI